MSDEKASDEARASASAVARWLGSSAGVLGLLVAVGFLVDRAAQDRLGLTVSPGVDPVRLAALAGEYLAVAVQDALLILQDAVRPPTALEAAAAVVIAVAVALVVRLERVRPFASPALLARVLRFAWLSGAIAAVTAALVVVDLPAILIRDMLLTGPGGDKSIQARGRVGERARDAFRDQVCARVESLDDLQRVTRRADYCGPPAVIRALNTDDRKRVARERIEARFGWACLAGCFALLVVTSRSASDRSLRSASPAPPPKRRGIRALVGWPGERLEGLPALADRLGGALLAVLASLHLLLLPLVFGKTRQTTEAPLGVVFVRGRADSVESLLDAFLVGRTSRELVVYSGGALRTIPEARLYQVDINARADVVASTLGRVAAQAAIGPNMVEMVRP